MDKKITQTKEAMVVEIGMKLGSVFSEEFSEIITELCYQHLAKGILEGLEPEEIESNVISGAKKPVDIALRKKIRETFVEITVTGAENIMEEIKERLGANA